MVFGLKKKQTNKINKNSLGFLEKMLEVKKQDPAFFSMEDQSGNNYVCDIKDDDSKHGEITKDAFSTACENQNIELLDVWQKAQETIFQNKTLVIANFEYACRKGQLNSWLVF